MIVIVGPSGSGKTGLQDYLCNTYNLKKVITCTTRPPRDNEKNGSHYYFISETDFINYVSEDKICLIANYRGWSYGVLKSELAADIMVVTPSGLRELKKLGYKFTSIYLNTDRRTCLQRLLYRGDDIEEAYRRNLTDVGQFDGVEKECDYMIGGYFDEKMFNFIEVIMNKELRKK